MIIAITGPESSGKTTLAIELSKHFETVYIPELARFDLQEKDGNYGLAELESYAEEMKNLLATPSPLRFLDSDFLTLQIWEEVKLGSSHLRAVAEQAHQEITHYLLCKPDLPWTYDPLREDEFSRERLFDQYEAVLKSWKASYTIIDGDGPERFTKAVQAVLKATKKGS